MRAAPTPCDSGRSTTTRRLRDALEIARRRTEAWDSDPQWNDDAES